MDLRGYNVYSYLTAVNQIQGLLGAAQANIRYNMDTKTIVPQIMK